MDKQYKIGDEVLVRGIVNSEVRNGGIHVLHDGVDAFYTLDQIDEPEKPVIPQFVAEWVEYCKSNKLTLLGAFDPVSEHGTGLANTFTGEVWKAIDWAKRNQDIFAKAWLDGYEVKQPKLYTVEIPNVYHNSLGYYHLYDNLSFYNKGDAKDVRFELTEAEIKSVDERLWQFAKPVED